MRGSKLQWRGCVVLGSVLGIAACSTSPGAREHPLDGSSRPPPEAILGGVEGDWEFTIGGEGNTDDDVDRGGVRLATSVGYYLSDNFVLDFRQNLAFEETTTDTSKFATRLALDYVPTEDHLRPFLGANIGAVYGESVNETLSVAPETGFKLYLQDRAFLQVMLEFQVFFTKTEDTTEVLDRGEFVYSIGLGINF